jgi:hypothetical protein
MVHFSFPLTVGVGGGHITGLDDLVQTVEQVVAIGGDIAFGVGDRCKIAESVIGVDRLQIGAVVGIAADGFPGFARDQIRVGCRIAVVGAAIVGLGAVGVVD